MVLVIYLNLFLEWWVLSSDVPLVDSFLYCLVDIAVLIAVVNEDVCEALKLLGVPGGAVSEGPTDKR